MSNPTRVDQAAGRRPGETDDAWFRRTFGPMPAPVDGAESRPIEVANTRLRRASATLERSIPPVHRWCHLNAPELSGRVYGAAISIAKVAWQESRICLTGASRTGKTSLAVAMLRAWVAKHDRAAVFVAAHRLGMARLQHPVGHGEPELVETAMRAALALLDDVGSERDHAMNPVADVIFERHAQGLPTWVTTGLTREQLVKRYGLGVVARLFERAKIIHVGPRIQKSTSTEK